MWRFATACARGTFHTKTGFPCQDRLDCRVVGNQTLVAAVADGAGSAAMAERGADIVVKTVVDSLSRQLEGIRSDYDVMLRVAAKEARNRVYAEADQCGVEPRELATTLLSAVVGPENGSVLQIGDGVVAVSDGGNGWGWVLWPRSCERATRIPSRNRGATEFRWVFWPQRGEYANTTRFLTDADALESLRVAPRLGKVMDIALMTDGLESLALHYASTSVHGPFFQGMFRPLVDADEDREIKPLSASLNRFLSSERVLSRTDDDMSLVLASWRPQ